MIAIRPDDLTGEPMRALLTLHLAGMAAHTPAGLVHALDLTGLQRADVTVFGAWDADVLLGIAALRQHDDASGEIKSMRTHPDHLRRGVAAALLRHIIGEAQARGLSRLSLETGSGAAFDPALALYRAHGFGDGEAFGDYTASGFNRFLHRSLTPGPDVTSSRTA